MRQVISIVVLQQTNAVHRIIRIGNEQLIREIDESAFDVPLERLAKRFNPVNIILGVGILGIEKMLWAWASDSPGKVLGVLVAAVGLFVGIQIARAADAQPTSSTPTMPR